MSQGVLFAEPSCADVGVWCQINEGIDPGQWASLCRYIGTRSPEQFQRIQRHILPSPDSLRSRMQRLFSPVSTGAVPLVSLGPSGIGGEYQREAG